MGTQDEYLLRILQVMAEDQSKPPFDIDTVWPEYGLWFWSQLGPSEGAEAEEYSSFFARLLYRGRTSINRIWPILTPNMVPPRSRSDCQRYAQFTSAGLAYVCRNFLGTTFGEVTQRMGSLFLAERESIERRFERMERASQPVDLRLQKLVNRGAGALADLYFGRYKGYPALSGAEREALMDELEEAGARGALSAIYHVGIPPAAASLLPTLEQKILSVFDPLDPSLDGLIALGSVMFPALLDMMDDMVSQLAKPHSELREAVEETIQGSISESCEQLVEMQEKYNERYRSRRQDFHLVVVGFDPRRALYLDIMLQTDESKAKIKELADREEVPVSRIYDLRRLFKYRSQRHFGQGL